MKRLAAVCFMGLGLAGSGCSGSDENTGAASSSGGGGGSTTGGLSEAEFLSQYAELFCAALEICCQEAGFGYNPTFCSLMLSSSPDPSLAYDADAAALCLEQIGTVDTCATAEPPAACDEVFTGSTATGESCASDAECAPTDGAVVTCGISSGVCEAELRVGVGEACTRSCQELPGGGRVCSWAQGAQDAAEERDCYGDDGLYCGDDGFCHERVGLDAACSDSRDCAEDLYCQGGVCAATLGVGEVCGSVGAPCQVGLGCGDGGTCIELAPDGDPCTLGSECQNGTCSSAGTCGFDGGELADALLGMLCGG